MKKGKKVLAMALTLCMAVGTFAGSISALSACTPKTPSGVENQDPNGDTKKTLMRIAVSGDYKTSYIVGESFDPTGMIVTAYYNDSTREAVTDYTLSKTGPLERTDRAITITYNGKTADIAIDVRAALTYNTLITVPDGTTKMYIAEAEDIDYGNCVNSNDMTALPTIESPGRDVASGGLSVGSLSVIGNKFGFTIHSEVDATATLIMSASATHVNIPVTEYMRLLFNDKELKSDHVLQWTDGGWYNWENVEFVGLTLKKGDNIFSAEITGPNAPNLDCFYLLVNPQEGGEANYETFATIVSTNVREYTIQAETLDLTKCTNSNYPENPNPKPVTEANSDGGTNLSSLSLKGNTLGFNVENLTGQELTAYVVMRASANDHEMIPGEMLDFTHNDVKMTSASTLPWTGEWNVCGNAVYDPITLVPGNNEFELVVTLEEWGCPNLDYFRIILMNEGEQVEYETFVTITDPVEKEYKVEAESLDLTYCTNSNYPELTEETKPITETNTDGGTNLSALSLGGNKLGFTVENQTDKPLTAHILMRASANERDMYPGEILDFTHNGVKMTSSSKLTWPGQNESGKIWNVCGDAVYDPITLVPGANRFELVVKSKEEGCPNIDYFMVVLEDGEQGGGDDEEEVTYATFATITDPTTKEYKIEAEALDVSKCTNSNYPEFTDELTPRTEPNQDGGTSLKELSFPGNKIGFTVENQTEQPLTAHIVMRASANESDMVPGNILIFTHNGVAMTSTSTLPWTGQYNVCNDAIYSTVTLVPGKNVFELAVKSKEEGCPNIDYFMVVLEDGEQGGEEEEAKYATFATITDPTVKEYKVEAEALDLSQCRNSNNPESKPGTETNQDGGTSLNSLSLEGNTLGFNVVNQTDQPLTAHILMRASANFKDMIPGKLLNFTHNGVKMASTSILTWPGEGQWNFCGDAIYSSITLQPGNNVFELVVLSSVDGCPNIDYFTIVLDGDDAKVEYATHVTITDPAEKEYKVEAEALDLTYCTNSNYPEYTTEKKPTTEENKDGGTNLSALSLAGNTLGFNVKNDTGRAITVRVILRASANGTDMFPGDLLDFTHNGVKMTTTSKLTWPGEGQWNTCMDAVYDAITLQPGDNQFQLVVKSREGGCPNLDYFKIELADEDGNFPTEDASAEASSISAASAEIALPAKFTA